MSVQRQRISFSFEAIKALMQWMADNDPDLAKKLGDSDFDVVGVENDFDRGIVHFDIVKKDVSEVAEGQLCYGGVMTSCDVKSTTQIAKEKD